jgi:dienelactone hydrolase
VRAEVQHLTLGLVDPSRPTPAVGGQAERPERRLPTEIYLPAGSGPAPLIAFSHGWAGHPRKFTQLFRAWADAGYVVAAPTFPVSNDRAPGGPSSDDAANQPGDISFVIDEVLAGSADPDGALSGRVDPERIGVAGLSLGGFTTYDVAFDDCCRDDRIDAAIVMDGAVAVTAPSLRLGSGLPLMIMHGDRDYLVPYTAATSAFRQAVAPRWLVTIHEAIHFEPYENARDPADELVRATTIAFWDRYLGDDEAAEQRLEDAVDPPQLAGLRADP